MLIANDRSAHHAYFQVMVVVVVVVVVVVEVVVVVVVLVVVVAVSVDSMYVQLSRQLICYDMHKRLGACSPERPSCLGACFLFMLHKESGAIIRNQN